MEQTSLIHCLTNYLSMTTFTLTGDTSTINANYHPPVVLEENFEYVIGLVNFEAYNAIPNIDTGINKLYLGNEVITIPTGSYEFSDINNYIQGQIKSKNIKFSMSANNNTLKCTIMSDKEINFERVDSIGPLLGFKKQKLQPNVSHESSLPVNILKTNTVRIECNIVTGAYNNNELVHTLHEFFPTVPPGFKIVETPQNVIYLPINTKTIDSITLKIVDQDGNLINFRKELVTIRLHLKRL